MTLPEWSEGVGPYRGPAWLAGGHAQTIYPYFLRRPAITYRRERVDTADGEFWDFDWLVNPAPAIAPDAPVVVLFHGLEGSAQSHYALETMVLLARRGWGGVVPHFRGCGGTPNRRPRAYHSGDHAEVGAMLEAVRARVGERAPLYAIGISLGGSALLNWLGRAGASAGTLLVAASTASVPLDLTASGRAIGRGLNRIYTKHFLLTLKPKALEMATRYPSVLSSKRIRRARSMWDFDETVTAPLHGFTGADDYWIRASSKPWLAQIRLPTLVLNARNDPFVPAESLPGPGDVGRCVTLEQPSAGGHVGFMTAPWPGRVDWLPRRLLTHFDQHAVPGSGRES